MTCICRRCNGEGILEIDYPDCKGDGTSEASLEELDINPEYRGFEELIELQKDAKRVVAQAKRLMEIKPYLAASYREQMNTALSEINDLADEVIQRNKLCPTWVRGRSFFMRNE